MDPFEVSPFGLRSGGTGLVPAAEALAAELMSLAPIVEAHIQRAEGARNSGIAELAAGADESERHLHELHAYDTAEEADAAGGTLEGGDLTQARFPVHPGEAEQPPPGYYLADRVTGTAHRLRSDVERIRNKAPSEGDGGDGGRGGGDRGAGRREQEEEAPPPTPGEAPPPPPPPPERNGGRK